MKDVKRNETKAKFTVEGENWDLFKVQLECHVGQKQFADTVESICTSRLCLLLVLHQLLMPSESP